LLASREHSRFELRNKLLRRGYDADEVEHVLDTLGEEGLQSDERYAEHYVELRRAKGYGPLRIRAELRERGVADGLIDIMVDEGDPVWYETLRQVHDKKYGADLPDGMKERAARSRFLGYRGFTGDQVRRLLLGNG